jgi:hypothetical protein
MPENLQVPGLPQLNSAKPARLYVKLHLIAAVGIFSGACALATPNVDSLIANAPGPDKFPQASAILLYDQRTVTLDADGRSHTDREYIWKILDERAKDQYGDQSVRFDAEEDTVMIETARTRLPDGSWIEPEHDAFTITSAPEVQWASAYSQLKQRNVSFPGMGVGAAIHFHYRIEPKPGSKAPKDPEDGGITLFGNYEPTMYKSLTISVPPSRTLRFEMQNSTQEPQVSKQGDRTIYTWEFRNIDQILDEPNSVGLSDLVPRLLWTTFPDWEALDLYVLERFLEKVDTAGVALAGYAKITAPDLSGIPAIMNTTYWVQHNVRNVSLSFGAVGYEPNTADRIWQNKYGDPRDKAVLLSALLESYGVETIPVLVTNSTAQFSELPVLEQFSHIILAVPQADDTLWLDPTTEYYSPGELPFSRSYSKACILAHGMPLLSRISPSPIESRSTKTTMQLELAQNGDLAGTVVCEPRGQFAASARATFKDQKQQERDIYFQRIVSRFGQGSKTTKFDMTDPADLAARFAVTMGFESPGYAVKQDDLMLMELPGNPFNFGTAGFYPSLPEVRYPVSLPAQGRSQTEIIVNIPSGYTVSYIAPPVIVDNPYIHLELAAQSGQQTITWHTVAEIKADKVPLADYKAIREAYETFALPKNRLAILEEKKGH